MKETDPYANAPDTYKHPNDRAHFWESLTPYHGTADYSTPYQPGHMPKPEPVADVPVVVPVDPKVGPVSTE